MEKDMYEKLDKSVTSCVEYVYEMDKNLKRIVSSLECIVKENDIGNEEYFNMELMLKNESVWRNFTKDIIASFEKYVEELSKQSNRLAEIELRGFEFLGENSLKLVKDSTDEQIKIIESIHDSIRVYSEYIRSLEKSYKKNLDEEWLSRAKSAVQESILNLTLTFGYILTTPFGNNEFVINT